MIRDPVVPADGPSPWLPERYRDIVIYAFSPPGPGAGGRVDVSLKLVNRSGKPLWVHVELAPNGRAGFPGLAFDAGLSPGGEVVRSASFEPPPDLCREVLEGRIGFADPRCPTDCRWDRDLYVALHGRVPRELDDPRAEPIDGCAAVIAAYAPRRPVRSRTEASSASERPFVLASKGRTDYAITAEGLPPRWSSRDASQPRRDTPGLRLEKDDILDAIDDLRRCIEVQTGARLDIRSEHVGPAIRLVLTSEPADAARAEEYHLCTLSDGDVRVESPSLAGLRHGIYGLLTDYLGCHWFLPGRLGEEFDIPADRTARLPRLDERRSPSFESVTGMSWGAAPRWDRRNRSLIGRGGMRFGHAWAGYLGVEEYPPEKFPELWARDRDGRVRQADTTYSALNFCSTSPEVIEIVAAKINAVFDAVPDLCVASIDPNNYAPMCLCDRCLALDRRYGQTRADGQATSDRLVHFAHEIFARLKPSHRGKLLGSLAYGYQVEPPISARPDPRHAVLLAQYPPRFDHTRPWNDPTSACGRDFARLLRAWGGLVSSLGLYDHYGHYYYFGPWAILHKIREEVPAFREMGGTYLMIEAQPNFGMQGLNLYLAARLAWDADTDADALLEQFFDRFYAPAAEPMRAFWFTAERRFALTRPGTNAERAADGAGFWEELDTHLRDAEFAVARVTATDERFQHRVAFHRAGFDLGRWHHGFKAQYLPRDSPPLDPVGAIAALEHAAPWLDRLSRAYPSLDGYYPPLISPKLFPQPRRTIAEFKAWQSDPTRPRPRL